MCKCKRCGKEINLDAAAYCPYCGSKQQAKARKAGKRANGEGTVYKRGKTYRAEFRWTEVDGVHVKGKGGFETKKAALDYLAANRDRGSLQIHRTFAQVYEEWSSLHYNNISDKKVVAYKAAFKKVGVLHTMAWRDIGIRHLQAQINACTGGFYSKRTMKDLFSLMSQYAILSGYGDKNYATELKLPPKQQPHKEPFTREDVDRLWFAYRRGDTFAGQILIMIYTGMRYGEASTIKPEDIHLDKGYMMGGIKTAAGKEGEILIIDKIKPLVESIMLPVNQIGEVSAEGFRARFDACLQRTGCEPHRPHECRHTTATLLAQEGVQPAIIKEIMRHASYQQTIEYTHIDRDTKLQALSNL